MNKVEQTRRALLVLGVLSIASCSSLPEAPPPPSVEEEADAGVPSSIDAGNDVPDSGAADAGRDGGTGPCDGVTCADPLQRCFEGACQSVLEVACSAANKFGSCPADQECYSQGCQALDQLDAASGAFGTVEQRKALFEEIFSKAKQAYPYGSANWEDLDRNYRPLFVSRKTLRSAYWALGQLLAELKDVHADAYSTYLCGATYGGLLPARHPRRPERRGRLRPHGDGSM